MLRISFEELHSTLREVLLRKGFRQDRADLCARLFAETSRDGVYSHGLNRFPRFIRMIEDGFVDVQAEPECAGEFGALERWDGKLGPGNLNAYACMERAMQISRKHGIGCVALSNTNHWMRGGTYGWQAADAGLMAMCWTNTMPNLPPWDGLEPRLGNNPFVIAVPRSEGHIVLDMAMSQFSYGALSSYRMRGELLPVEGGFDAGGNLTRDPAEIEATSRPLPAGFWKGSGLALMLDLTAALLSGGNATYQILPDPDRETAISQVFLAFDLPRLYSEEVAGTIVNEVITFLHSATPVKEGKKVYYPGERTLRTRKENQEEGIPVEPAIWKEVLAM